MLLAVDDFGTGDLGPVPALRVPIDILKIDRLFIDGIELDMSKRQPRSGIVNLSETKISMQVSSLLWRGSKNPSRPMRREMRSPLGRASCSRGRSSARAQGPLEQRQAARPG